MTKHKQKEPQRGANKKRKFAMDYIPDKELYKAVMFARKMIRSGTPPSIANARAAQCYNFTTSDVAKYVGQVGGTCRSWRRR